MYKTISPQNKIIFTIFTSGRQITREANTKDIKDTNYIISFHAHTHTTQEKRRGTEKYQRTPPPQYLPGKSVKEMSAKFVFVIFPLHNLFRIVLIHC